ncbi:ligase-associated DNA damage response DEXH box helicase [Rhodopirellula bahusiensis]|uniref:ligase-associated DNA damage response DEXH box helicase n=1 Tax=Rhodopirellula bahusiensis TaxID=2014065 RepID=UPI0032650C59
MNSSIPTKRETPSQIVDRFFASVGWKPFAFQRTVWRSYRDGCSGLLHSATGTGKTLGVWMGPILNWLQKNPDPSKWNPKRPPAVRVLWVTPLRALAGDTESSLRAPLDSLGLPWTLESRTGDSKQSMKARQLKKLPTALVTTPESLSLMLTHKDLMGQLSELEAVIVDEWHELLGTKRGIQTELALSRLKSLNPNLRIWGVSATLGNLQEACDALVSDQSNQQIKIVEGFKNKKVKFQSLIPSQMDRFPWSGHIGTRMVPQVVELLDSVNSALVFANTRSQTEIWYQHLLKQKPEWAGQIAIHHGSLDMSVRQWVEEGLRGGKLRAVVCTSSLDLGVDFTAVDLVIQIGSPKGAARLLQRAGRSGHQPDATSRLAFVPTNTIELIELAAAQDSIRSGKLEARPMLDKPLDVLAQHVVTIAIGGGFTSDELLKEVRTAHAYRSLTEIEWKWVLDFVVRGGESLDAYPDFHRVEINDERYQVTQRRTITNHRMNIGTIVADASMQVKFLKGKTLGTAEESFLSRIKPGEKFLFAGRLVELVRVKDNAAYVRRATGKPDTVPRWMGSRMPLSTELSQALRQRIQQASEGQYIGREMNALRPLLALQSQWSTLPREDELLMEKTKTRGGFHLFLFPFEGRLVHEGMAALFAHRMSKLRKQSFSMACNDHGIVLQSPTEIQVEQAVTAGVFATGDAAADILESMNSTSMAKRQFRQIARVAGLIHPGLPGRRKSANHLQASSNLFFDVFCQYDPQNMLLEQSRREVLEQQLESTRLLAALRRIEASRIIINEPDPVTPLAFGLLVDKLRERVSSETLADRVRRMKEDLERAAEGN